MLKIKYDVTYFLLRDKKSFILVDENKVHHKLQRAKIILSEKDKISYKAVLFPFAHNVIDPFPKDAQEIFYVCTREENLIEGDVKFVKRFILDNNKGPYWTFLLLSNNAEYLLQTHIFKIKKKKRKH